MLCGNLEKNKKGKIDYLKRATTFAKSKDNLFCFCVTDMESLPQCSIETLTDC